MNDTPEEFIRKSFVHIPTTFGSESDKGNVVLANAISWDVAQAFEIRSGRRIELTDPTFSLDYIDERNGRMKWHESGKLHIGKCRAVYVPTDCEAQIDAKREQLKQILEKY